MKKFPILICLLFLTSILALPVCQANLLKVWTGPMALSVVNSYVVESQTGKQTFKSKTGHVIGTVSYYTDVSGIPQQYEGCYLSFQGTESTDNTTMSVCIDNLGFAATTNVTGNNDSETIIADAVATGTTTVVNNDGTSTYTTAMVVTATETGPNQTITKVQIKGNASGGAQTGSADSASFKVNSFNSGWLTAQ